MTFMHFLSKCSIYYTQQLFITFNNQLPHFTTHVIRPTNLTLYLHIYSHLLHLTIYQQFIFHINVWSSHFFLSLNLRHNLPSFPSLGFRLHQPKTHTLFSNATPSSPSFHGSASTISSLNQPLHNLTSISSSIISNSSSKQQ